MASMARPKRPRLIDGIRLADNLYPDNKGRPGYFRYVRPNGSFKHFCAASVTEANAIAEEANALRETFRPADPLVDRTSFAFYLARYIEEREEDDAGLAKKPSWRNRKYFLAQFCREFPHPVHRTTFDLVRVWWRGLTHAQQGSRRPEFRRFFNYLMSERLCPALAYNPFTTADDRPKLARKGSPGRKRARLALDQFWAIYDEAGRLGYAGLQVAMGVALITGMREADICALRVDRHVDDAILKTVISKSAAQVGAARAARLAWDLDRNVLLRRLIQRGRELSMRNGRCPFLISYSPRHRVMGAGKSHHCQVLPRLLIAMFAEARKVISIPAGRTAPSFHEIRSLFSKLAEDAGYEIEQIQTAMAHGDKSTTIAYQAEHLLPHRQVEVVLDKTVLGREF